MSTTYIFKKNNELDMVYTIRDGTNEIYRVYPDGSVYVDKFEVPKAVKKTLSLISD